MPVIRAAGGVLWRADTSEAIEVVLVHRPQYGDWSLPKGKLRPGEHPLVTACREVAEETGVRAVAGRRLDIEHYGTATGPKAVEYWAMQGADAAFAPTQEVDRLAWLPLPEARQLLDHPRDRYAIETLGTLEARARRIAGVLLVRNGHTRPVTHDADGQDPPLSARGKEQAEAVRQTLPAFMPSRLLAAPDKRFAGTIGPLGVDLGLPVEAEPRFGEEAYAASPYGGLARIHDLARTGPMTAVCASGRVIRHLIAALADDAGLALGDIRARKGSAWALFLAGGRLAAADYYPALTSPLARTPDTADVPQPALPQASG